MKLLKIIFAIVITLNSNFSFSQGENCANAMPFCTDNSFTFPLPINGGEYAESGPDYTCLDFQPNPVWYYMQVESAGDITIHMHSTCGDLDFTCWGPFSSQQCGSSLNASNTVDCSYSILADEDCHIPSSQVGDVYMLMISNYGNCVGNVEFSQISGTGGADCSIVIPCDIDITSANTPNCATAGVFTVSGEIAFSDQPTTGTLTITDDISGLSNTYSAPFTSPLSYSISNITADGASHTLTATFSDEAICSATEIFTAPNELPEVTSLTSSSPICSGDNAVFTIVGTPNATLTYNIDGGANQTIDLDASGNGIVTEMGVIANTIINLLNITYGGASSTITGNGLSATGGANPNNSTGGILTTGTTLNNTNSAQINSANPTLTLNLEHTVPSGTAITISICRNNSNGDVDITDGTNTQTFNAGPDDISQQITFTTGQSTNTLVFSRNGGGTWLDGVEYSFSSTLPVCSTTLTMNETVSVNPNPTPSITGALTYCYGFSTDLDAGTGYNNYAWSPSGNSQILNVTTGGTYTVTVTDANGCTGTDQVTVIEPTEINLSNVVTNLQCYNSNNGTITINASGGIPSYQYSIDGTNFQSANNFTGLSAGFYNITVVDDSSCTQTINNIEITQPTELLAIALETNVLCNSNNTGAISVTANGGTPVYEYSINAGASYQASNQFNNLIAGTYSIIVIDDSLCTYQIDNIIITEPTALNIQIDSIVNVLCNGDNTGSIAFTTTGGNPNNGTPNYYEYSFNNISFTTDSIYTGMNAGNYWVYVLDNNSCKDSINFDITEPANPISLTPSSLNSTCGNANGTAIVTASGGTASYSYAWADDVLETTNTLSGIVAGNYIVTVTDNNNCTETATVNVSDFGAGTLTFLNDTHNLCHGDTLGTVEVNITGGTSPFTYTWDNGQTDSIAINLAAGTYSVEVEDANNCIVTNSFTILDSTQIQISLTQYNLNCFNDNSGIITAVVTGGSPASGTDYNYNWSNGINGINLDSISGLSANIEYILTVTDQYNCEVTDTVILSQPDTLIIDSIIVSNLTCYNNNTGYAIIDTVLGGTGQPTYLWSNGENTIGIGALNVGTYFVTVQDNNLCTITDSVVITQPDSIIVTPTILPTYCNQDLGSINIEVTGGTTEYSYLWSNTLDSNFIDSLAEGTYFVTITDANLCQSIKFYEIINIPAGVLEITDIKDLDCYNDNSGKILAQITGGNPIYNFEWTKNTSIIQQGDVANNQDSLINISAGIYTLTVIDSNNCVTIQNITITQPDSLQADYDYMNVACAGESNAYINATITGGIPNYIYNWSNGINDNNITNLTAGEYSLTVVDANGCSISDTIIINQPEPYSISETHTDITCYSYENGQATIYVEGGTLPYSYNWNTGDTSQILEDITAGTYIYQVTDANNCKYIDTIILVEPQQITVSDTVYYENKYGVIELETYGGTPSYVYNWNTGETSNQLENLGSGIYYVTISDANNCELIKAYEIEVPLFIPTVITPNADGYNDTWRIVGLEQYKDVEIIIFNRWGDKLYQFKGHGYKYSEISQQWDGTWNGNELPLGTYVYIIRIAELENEKISGVITIVR